MAKEKPKMTLNVRNRTMSVADAPPPIDPARIEAFASGVDTSLQTEEPATPKSSSEQKVVRDAFTMPAEDHDLFAEIQKKCISLGIVVTKSEIVRAGLKHLSSIPEVNLEEIMKAVPKIKTGRPGATKK